jgi:hypothetical protein
MNEQGLMYSELKITTANGKQVVIHFNPFTSRLSINADNLAGVKDNLRNPLPEHDVKL